jgi:hypothetical protein
MHQRTLALTFLFVSTAPPSLFSEELLRASSVQRLQGGLIQIDFVDRGTGATPDDYILEASPTLDPADWKEQTAIVDNRDGQLVATAFAPAANAQFFRVRVGDLPGNGGSTTASFATSDIVREEGSGEFLVRVNFSGPYNGLLKYSWAGAGNLNGLSGIVQANGTSAFIPLTVQDNTSIDELQNLVLTLVADESTGYTVADEGGNTNITILENDAVWRGSFSGASEHIDLGIELIKRGDHATVKIVSDGSGLLPAGAFEATGTPSVTPGAFQAEVPAITIPANPGNMLDSRAVLGFSFDAVDGRGTDTVGAQLMEGATTLSLKWPDAPHLDTQISGRFTVVKQVIAPSTADVPLGR